MMGAEHGCLNTLNTTEHAEHEFHAHQVTRFSATASGISKSHGVCVCATKFDQF